MHDFESIANFPQRYMNVLKTSTCVSTSAPTQMGLTSAPVALATFLLAMDSVVQV